MTDKTDLGRITWDGNFLLVSRGGPMTYRVAKAEDLVAALEANPQLRAEVLAALGATIDGQFEEAVQECRHEFGVTGKCLSCGMADAVCESLFLSKLKAEDGAMEYRRKYMAARGEYDSAKFRERELQEKLEAAEAELATERARVKDHMSALDAGKRHTACLIGEESRLRAKIRELEE